MKNNFNEAISLTETEEPLKRVKILYCDFVNVIM